MSTKFNRVQCRITIVKNCHEEVDPLYKGHTFNREDGFTALIESDYYQKHYHRTFNVKGKTREELKDYLMTVIDEYVPQIQTHKINIKSTLTSAELKEHSEKLLAEVLVMSDEMEKHQLETRQIINRMKKQQEETNKLIEQIKDNNQK
jgi:hypothetical protein